MAKRPISSATHLIAGTQTLTSNPTSYAAKRNSRFKNTASHIRTLQQRWTDTINAMPPADIKAMQKVFVQAINIFRINNPHIRTWNDIKLPRSINVPLSSIRIDATMQRQLCIEWVLRLLTTFKATRVIPIQVYSPTNDDNDLISWDGQHTVILLWVIATQVFGLDPDKVMVPVNISSSCQKAEIRDNFITLNSDKGKRKLDAIDHWEQMVFGVVIDNSLDPVWVDRASKQLILDQRDLFVTSRKFNDTTEIGAISRMPEMERLSVSAVDNLTKYLVLSTQKSREINEKEMMIMGHFFERCDLYNNSSDTPKKNKFAVDDAYITDLHATLRRLFNCGFEVNGMYWNKVQAAYDNWYKATYNKTNDRPIKKDLTHVYPFLMAQLAKSFNHPLPSSTLSSDFAPLAKDLF